MLPRLHDFVNTESYDKFLHSPPKLRRGCPAVFIPCRACLLYTSQLITILHDDSCWNTNLLSNCCQRKCLLSNCEVFLLTQYSFAPAGILSSRIRTLSPSLPSTRCVAEMIIPQESIPVSYTHLMCAFFNKCSAYRAMYMPSDSI